MGSGTENTAGADGVEIAFTVEGDGPPVLLIHGFPDDRTLWAERAAARPYDGPGVSPPIR